jgi:peptidyl-prolyl cis-trans isomerase SurA
LLIIKEGKWFEGDDHEIDNIQWITGSQSFSKDGFASIIFIKKVIDSAPLTFKEVQGEMLTGYQEYLESEWIKQLKEKYSVKIDSLVLEEVKKMLKNE